MTRARRIRSIKFRTTCVDDMTSGWLASYGDVNRYDFLANRPIQMNGYVHNAEGYAKSCQSGRRILLRNLHRHNRRARHGLLR